MNLKLNPGESLTGVLSGAATTTNPYVMVRYQGNGGLKKAAVQLNGATAATLLTGEAQNGSTVIGMSAYNSDTAAITMTLAVVIAGVSYTIRVVTLQVGDTLSVDANGTPLVQDTNGRNRSNTSTVTAAGIAISATEWRKTDGVTLLAATAATTNHGLVYGTDGTDFPHLETIDGKNATTIVVSRTLYRLPSTYVAGASLTLRAFCGMKTTVASNSASTTIGFNVYANLGTANTGSADLCATAAQSMNSLTLANKDFIITPTGLVPGQDIHIKMTTTVTDVATGTAVIGTVNHVELRLGSA